MGINVDEITKQIEAMADKMEKSSKDPKDGLFAIIKSLGAKGLKEKLSNLSDDEKVVLKAALEEMSSMKKALDLDKEAQGAKFVQGKVADTIIQEDKADDDADEKLVKPAAATMNHQGTPTDGWEGQVIKGGATHTMPKKEAIKEHERLVSTLESKSKEDDKKEAKIQRKELKEMKKSEVESNLDEIVEKAMDKCNNEDLVKEKLKAKGVDGAKVQGALDKFKQKKVAKSEELEKAKKDDAKEEAREKAAEKIMAMEEKEHGTKDPKKLVQAEKEENKKEKMKKSLTWGDDNQLLKANTLGRNFNFNVGEFIEKTLASEPTEEIFKASSKEDDLNDLIKKGEDRSWTQIQTASQISSSKTNGTLVKSFEDNDIASILGLSEEEAKKILG